jgi:magnesium transporter
MATLRSEAHLQHSLAEVTRLLDKHRVLATLTHRQEGPKRDLLENLQHRQNVAELRKRLGTMHAADVAYVLEALPLDGRGTVWQQLTPEIAAAVFVEVSATVRESLVAATPRAELVALLSTLDPDDLGYVSDALPEEVLSEVSQTLESRDRTVLEDSIHYADDTIGRYMSRELVAVSESATVGQVLDELRERGELPTQTDRIFVIDARHGLRGSVPLPALLVRDPSIPITGLIADDTISFGPHDSTRDAVNAFERYNLVSAAVVDERGKLVGRLTVDAAMDVLRDESNLRALQHAGLSGDEDLFAAPWQSAKNRWPWLGINLFTAFIVSRVIGQFEGAIQQLAALAALMPIVASIGGNTGNQTMALVIRALAVDRLQARHARRLMRKELAISVMNGSFWGLLVGVFATILYANFALGVVMSGAVVLNLLTAALAGVTIPLGLHATGRDPAHGSSVLLTFITDAMGFFLVLGLATIFLV